MQLVTLAEQNTSLAYIWLTKGKKKKIIKPTYQHL